MTSTSLFSFAIAASVSFNFLVGFQLLKQRRSNVEPAWRNDLESMGKLPNVGPASIFPEAAALDVDESLSPLQEAEVYWAYGRLDDAEFVLSEGLRTGRINAADIEQFWQGVAKNKQANVA